MKLKLVYSTTNMVVRLINVDAKASERSSNRVLDSWAQSKGTNLRVSFWNNDMVSSLNPFHYNRVNVHYDNHRSSTITKSYYCIDDIIHMEEMTFEDFDDNVVE